jgi:aspartate-semialdehyde dehydrogenase
VRDLLRRAERCVRVPVLVGRPEAVWVELEQPLSAADGRDRLGSVPDFAAKTFRRLPTAKTTSSSAGSGKTRRSRAAWSFFVVGGNLRKGAVLKRSRSRSRDSPAEW